MKKLILLTAIGIGFTTTAIAEEISKPKLLDDVQLDALTAGAMPENPGWTGQTNAYFAPGFAKASAANGRDIVQATYLFGNKGKGNGADPDPLGLATDHDPGVVGGAPDMYR